MEKREDLLHFLFEGVNAHESAFLRVFNMRRSGTIV